MVHGSKKGTLESAQSEHNGNHGMSAFHWVAQREQGRVPSHLGPSCAAGFCQETVVSQDWILSLFRDWSCFSDSRLRHSLAKKTGSIAAPAQVFFCGRGGSGNPDGEIAGDGTRNSRLC